MTPADIDRLAREAGFAINSASSLDAIDGRIARFAALVEAAERERAAKVCDGIAEACDHSSDGLKRVGAINAAKSCAKLIRGN